MKIIGGSYGVTGTLSVADDRLNVRSTRSASYSASEIDKVVSRTEKQRRFGVFGFLIGAFILAILFGIFLNILGVVIGIALAAAGSFYSTKTYFAVVTFTDGGTVEVEASHRQITRLVAFKG